MKEFIKYFSEISELCQKLSDTYNDLSFDKDIDATEVMTLTYLKLVNINTKSISLLLENDLYIPTILISRNIFEAFFNLNWVFEVESQDERREQVYRLEGEPYFNFEKELKLMEEEQKEEITTWKKEVVEDLRRITIQEMKDFPHLITKDKNGNLVFKTPPNFADRMRAHRLKFYHIYRFTSFFTHPTPRIKEFLLSKSINGQTPLEYISEPLSQMYTYIILYISSIMEYSRILFEDFSPSYKVERKLIIDRIKEIINESNKNYFGFKKETT